MTAYLCIEYIVNQLLPFSAIPSSLYLDIFHDNPLVNLVNLHPLHSRDEYEWFVQFMENLSFPENYRNNFPNFKEKGKNVPEPASIFTSQR